ncbi:uncharacterized protein LOC120843806 [Ixodes scapularis]|uniref:uncharacterized protein LOC120843806 n=1 Tax=Ixodes scapularis TaxID=6945 RepID=UPI001A9F9EE3|nr:uncharacterized protein LOC120843806 [Ixodes scapularis]
MFEESDSVVEKLIEGVRLHPCVYDTRKLEYRDTARKDNAWEAIRELCGLPTVGDCQKLWKRLRDRFTRETRALELTKRSGSGFVARHTWEFMQAMEFYKNCGRPKKTACNLDTRPLAMDADGDVAAEDLFHLIQSGAPSPSEDNCTDLEQMEVGQSQLNNDGDEPALRATTGVSSGAPKKRKKSGEFEQQLLYQLDKKMTKNEAFGMSIGMSLDRLFRPDAAKCKARIMDIIAEYDN